MPALTPRQLLLRMRTVFYTAGSTVARNGEVADRCATTRRWQECAGVLDGG